MKKMAEKLIKEAEATIPTDWGQFTMIAYRSETSDYTPDLALVSDNFDSNEIAWVRIHSECITGDLFHSQKCDCGAQLDAAMTQISDKNGVLIYLRQEGRGIGLINKLKAYNKQAEGMDTVEANVALGFEIDYRQYEKALSILQNLGVQKIKLLTNNPDKIEAFENSKIEIVEHVSLEIPANENNKKYLQTKKDALGHILDL